MELAISAHLANLYVSFIGFNPCRLKAMDLGLWKFFFFFFYTGKRSRVTEMLSLL